MSRATYPFVGLLCDPDWLMGLQQSLDAHMSDMMDAVMTGDASNLVVESGRRFCGCEACIVREILAFTLPKVVAAMNGGKIRVHTEQA